MAGRGIGERGPHRVCAEVGGHVAEAENGCVHRVEAVLQLEGDGACWGFAGEAEDALVHAVDGDA
ncbi:hypothetical protein [Nesterenkonia pannonica]|uniref:hypothetical protein n=1 Tax=Nesterenkonia pannonica TaxID=1548602 RepID=UPI0021648B25|nr:hypothetical protein [Nesterenkonia pannonica]